MSTVLTCQDQSFVGGHRYNCLYRAQTSTDNVDVTTETQASFWDTSPTEDTCQHESLETITCLSCGTSPDSARTEHMSPHQRRNKQLQDTLIQRDEELARLQEENNKLKEFLNCSYVQNLEEQSKRLRSAHKQRKRTLQVDKGLHHLSTSQLIGSQVKRTCRNLSLEFCSSEDIATSPSVDHWILQTLGLKDADTIDTSTEYTFIPPFDSVCTRSPNNEHSDSLRQTKSQDTSNYSPATGSSPCIEPSTNYIPIFDTIDNYTCSTDSHCDITAAGPSVLSSPRVTAAPLYQVSPSPSRLPRLIGDPLSPEKRQHFTPVTASSPGGLRPHRTPSTQGFITPPTDRDSLPRCLPSPRCQADVAFTMSLSSSSSVRTHSFHQGQAFVRRHSQGGWSFTWVPIQAS